MTQLAWSMQTAKGRFEELLEAARLAPQTIADHGRPIVVVLDVVEYERLRRLERTRSPSFAEVLLAIPQDDGEFTRD
jgi:antitoxin Phd